MALKDWEKVGTLTKNFANALKIIKEYMETH